MKRVLLVVAALVMSGGIVMGVRAATDRSPDLEVVVVMPPEELVALPETLVVDTTGMDTCPGFTVQVPGPPLSAPTMGEGTDATLATVMLGPPAAAVLFVCYGSTAELGGLSEYTKTFLDASFEGGTITRTIIEKRYDFGDVLRRDLTWGTSSELSDLVFERDGWVYGVGYLSRPEDAATLEATFESVLASWTWS